MRGRSRLVAVPILLAALVAGYYGWLRDSSLVAVEKVRVEGITGPEAPQVIEALTRSGRTMTTLHVRTDELEAAVKGFPTVVSVSADPDLLHGLVIEVSERPPALIADARGESVPVAGDGTLLRGVELGEARDQLPVIELSELPQSGRLEGEALAQAVVLGAAPQPIRPLIEGVSVGGEDGVRVTLRGEIPVRFGTHERASSKWAAATAVLADPRLDTLTYVDVRVPEHPAVGGAGEPIAPDAAVAPIAPVEPAL